MLLATISFGVNASTWSDVKKQFQHFMSEPAKTGLLYCKIALEGTGTVIGTHMLWHEFLFLIDKLRNEKIRLEKNQLYGQLRQFLIVGGLGLITHKCLKSFINDVNKL